MKKMYKAMALVLCAILLVVGSVMGTLAYLKSQTATISNVMTVGKVDITLSESVVNEYGVATSDKIVATKDGVLGGPNSYKLIPGRTYTKDPIVTLKAGSEACYLFVKVTDGIVNIEKSEPASGSQAAVLNIAEQMTKNGWTQMNGTDVWYKHIAQVTSVDTPHQVFASFTIKGDAAVANYSNATIDITAYAVQAEGFDNAKAAWDASGFGTTNP